MLTMEFKGCSSLVDAIDRAVSWCSQSQLTDHLRRELCRVMREHEVELPACCFESVPDHYARRELYRSERHGYSVICMTWGPGQGTPIHDHSGMWCVEGVWRGALEITQYELLETAGERFRFQPVGSMQAGTGSAGSLIPPHEYHTIRNPSDRDIAVSLHIYKGSMRCCSVFKPLDDQWFERGVRQLGLDEAH